MPINGPRPKSGFRNRLGPWMVEHGEITQAEYEALCVLDNKMNQEDFRHTLDAVKRSATPLISISGLGSVKITIQRGNIGTRLSLASIGELSERIQTLIKEHARLNVTELEAQANEAQPATDGRTTTAGENGSEQAESRRLGLEVGAPDPERDERILKALREGQTFREIMTELHVNTAQINDVLARFGVESNFGVESKDDKIAAALRAGKSGDMVRAELHVSTSRIAQVRRYLLEGKYDEAAESAPA